MQNTSCLPSCEIQPRTRQVNLFGKTLLCKGYVCSRDGGPYRPKPDGIKLQLTIIPLSYCPGKCPFCIAWPGIQRKDRLDPARLENVLHQLKEQDIVRGISISGGEPFLDVPLLNWVINMAFEIFGTHIEVSVNTNGIGIERIHELDMLSYIDAVHISRHHYDESINRQLFGIPVPDNRTLKQMLHFVEYPDLFVLNCMLMKDYIGTPEEAHRFLDFAIEMGAGKVCFITGNPVNDFVRQQAVPYQTILRQDDAQLLFTRSYQDYEFCSCQDGVYVSAGGALMEFYGRFTGMKSFPYVRGFVYGADNCLRTGFSGEVLLK